MKKTKSRISKSKLTKKVHIPVWTIVLGILVLVGLGIVFVRNSFAYSTLTLYCVSGHCHASPQSGASEHTYAVNPDSSCPDVGYTAGLRWAASTGKRYNWPCVEP